MDTRKGGRKSLLITFFLKLSPKLQTEMSSKVPLQPYVHAKLFTAKVLYEETLEKEVKMEPLSK